MEGLLLLLPTPYSFSLIEWITRNFPSDKEFPWNKILGIYIETRRGSPVDNRPSTISHKFSVHNLVCMIKCAQFSLHNLVCTI